jgi:hypothetical protein
MTKKETKYQHFTDASKVKWGRKLTKTMGEDMNITDISNEEIIVGCLQRIADSMEAINEEVRSARLSHQQNHARVDVLDKKIKIVTRQAKKAAKAATFKPDSM